MTALPSDTLPDSSAVRVEGALLSTDLINKIRLSDRELPGAAPADYGLPRGVRVEDAASRKWNYLKEVWTGFRKQLAEHGTATDTTKLTRDQWLLVLLEELGYGRLTPLPRGGLAVPGRSTRYRVSHQWQDHLPVHLLPWDAPLDRAVGKRRAPQSLTQELLNVSRDHLWGLLSNGRVLRVLRDSTGLVGSSYVEFHLEAIFEGEQFADFQLLYAMLHSSRFALVPKPEKKRRRAATALPGAEQSDEEQSDEEQPAEDGEPGTLDAAAVPDEADTSLLTPADCRLEWWRDHSIETGTRLRERLRDQVRQALRVLGTGYLRQNPSLREALARGGKPALDEFHHELLRLAYQLVFLFVAEDRDVLLLQPEKDATKAEIEELDAARDRYARYFSTARLRRVAARRYGDHHTDLWESLAKVLEALGTDGGLPALALPELGGLYFRAQYDPRTGAAASLLPGSGEPLRDARLPNRDLLHAVKLLCRVPDDRGRPTRVDYRHLGADELGSVYESLLELIPRHSGDGNFWLQDLVAGNKRKTTGSYYTPTSLIEKLLDNALDPVIERFAASRLPDDLLNIRLVDPSCGSGHMLVAAARRIALRYVQLWDDESEPSPERVRWAMAKVVRSCVHGVDLNPLAAEIAKVSLWLESLTPGEPLAYLDDRVKVGNALLGTTPKLLEDGLPDGAFTKLPGDDSALLKMLKADNKRERPHRKRGEQFTLTRPLVDTGTATVRVAAEKLAKLPGGSLADIREHARQHEAFERRPDLKRLKRVADAWCAAFLWRKEQGAPAAITSATLKLLAENEDERLPGLADDEDAGERALDGIIARNRFFHWHLEFPRIFRTEERDAPDANPDTGWQGGFDCVLGNPPWERVKIQKKEWFAAQREDIADAINASERERMIERLQETVDDTGMAIEADRYVYREYQLAQRESKGLTLMLRNSGIFPLTGTGDVNTYAVFAEKARTLIAPEGMSGLVLPTGIATDKTTASFFGDLVSKQQLVTVLDLENEEKLFADVHNQYRYCLFSVSGSSRKTEHVRLAFRARRPDQLDAREFTLDAEGFAQINPNTRTSPVCEGPEYLRVLRGIHERVPLLWWKPTGGEEENPWGLRFLRMFDMAGDAKRFVLAETLAADGWILKGNVFSKGEERCLPLYEGKFAHHYDSRFATYENATQAQINKGTLPRLDHEKHSDARAVPLPRYWVPENTVEGRFQEEAKKKIEPPWSQGWIFGRRNVCRASDERTLILSVVPRTAAGDKLPLMLPEGKSWLLLANLSSKILDFAVRQKHAGVSLSYFILEQLPVLDSGHYSQPMAWLAGRAAQSWIRDRVLELSYTSYEMAPWARHLGDEGPPFVWNEERRFLIRTELDAAFFHLYGIPREDVDLVLDSFRAFRNRQPELFQRTKDEIVRVYEAMARGEAFAHPELTPPPGHGPRHEPGTSPLTRPDRPRPPVKPQTAPEIQDGLFGLGDIGEDEQLSL